MINPNDVDMVTLIRKCRDDDTSIVIGHYFADGGEPYAVLICPLFLARSFVKATEKQGMKFIREDNKYLPFKNRN